MKFDQVDITQIILSVSGVRDAKTGEFIGACFEWQFDWESDSTIGRLSLDHETLTLTGRGVAALKMAYEIQKRHTGPVRMTDSDYSFDLLLADFPIFENLRNHVLILS